jgi:hypothetical protein
MIPSSVRIFVCTKPHDMRCSYDTLALAAQHPERVQGPAHAPARRPRATSRLSPV